MTFLCVLAVIGTAFGFICWLWGDKQNGIFKCGRHEEDSIKLTITAEYYYEDK